MHYGNELAAYRRMRSELNDALAPGLRARAGAEHRSAEPRTQAGAGGGGRSSARPSPVLDKCGAVQVTVIPAKREIRLSFCSGG